MQALAPKLTYAIVNNPPSTTAPRVLSKAGRGGGTGWVVPGPVVEFDILDFLPRARMKRLSGMGWQGHGDINIPVLVGFILWYSAAQDKLVVFLDVKYKSFDRGINNPVPDDPWQAVYTWTYSKLDRVAIN